MIDWQALTLFLYITARMSGFVLFDPIFGRRSIPGIFRAGLALGLAVFVFEMSGQRAPVPVGTAELAVRLLLELIDSGGPGEVTHKLIAPRLVERNTCCSPQQRTAV